MEAALAEEFNATINKRIYTPFIDLWACAGPYLGRRIALFGQEQSGKSTLSYRIIAGLLRTCKQCMTPAIVWQDDAGKNHYTCKCKKKDFMNGMLIDTEGTISIPYLRQQGCFITPKQDAKATKAQKKKSEEEVTTLATLGVESAGSLVIYKPTELEEMYATAGKMLESGEIQFVVIDTINTLLDSTMSETWTGPVQMGGKSAKVHWSGLKRLILAQERAVADFALRPTIVWTNHVIDRIGMFFGGPTVQETGGRGPKSFAEQRIFMSRVKMNPTPPISKEQRKLLNYDIATEFFFEVPKSKTGMPSNKGGSYVIFNSAYATKAHFYPPGSTNEHNKLLSLLEPLKLYVSAKDNDGKSVWCLGAKFPTEMAACDFLSREDIQFEARYWIGKLILPELAKRSLLLEDYFYGVSKEAEKRHKEIEAAIEKNKGTIQTNVRAMKKELATDDEETSEEES
jgi:RecA/RadA recombinase